MFSVTTYAKAGAFISKAWAFPRGGTFPKIVRGCAYRTLKIGLSLYQLLAQLPTHQYTILKRKAPNFAHIGCLP